jgi:ATPase subunit of ABC transporter with duplicated ATPase domains
MVRKIIGHFWNTDRQLLDHVTEYLAEVSHGAYPTDNTKREEWLHARCKQLKHEAGAANKIITEMEKLSKKTSLTKKVKEKLSSAQTYFKNHNDMMDYSTHIDEKLPIGSGVTEAACKTLVKQRLCGSGMRWKEKGAKTILSLRALVQSKGRWQQFWNKIQQYGTQVFI